MKMKALTLGSMVKVNGGKVIHDTGAGTNPRVWTYDTGYQVVVIDGKAVWKSDDPIKMVAFGWMSIILHSIFHPLGR